MMQTQSWALSLTLLSLLYAISHLPRDQANGRANYIVVQIAPLPEGFTGEIE